MTKKQSLLFGAVLVVLALVWSLLQRPESTQTMVQNPAPEFQLASIENGKVVKLSDFAGKVRLLVFWATWCPPCVAEIPSLIALQSEYGPKGFQIISISLDEGKESIEHLNRQFSFNYPVALGTQEIVEAYGNFPGVPMSFLVDRKGTFISVIPGMIDEDQIKPLIESALSE